MKQYIQTLTPYVLIDVLSVNQVLTEKGIVFIECTLYAFKFLAAAVLC